MVKLIHCLQRFDNEPMYIFVYIQAKSLGLREQLNFPQKTSMVVKKWQKFYNLVVVGWYFFCSRGGPTETNIGVQFRVIASFKLLHWKGFYSAIYPEVTKKTCPSAIHTTAQFLLIVCNFYVPDFGNIPSHPHINFPIRNAGTTWSDQVPYIYLTSK